MLLHGLLAQLSDIVELLDGLVLRQVNVQFDVLDVGGVRVFHICLYFLG